MYLYTYTNTVLCTHIIYIYIYILHPLRQAAAKEEEADQQIVLAKQALLGGGWGDKEFVFLRKCFLQILILYPKQCTTSTLDSRLQ